MVYALVPNQSLEAMVHAQAERLAMVEQTMRLEDQAADSPDARHQERLIEQIIRTEARRLWEQA